MSVKRSSAAAVAAAVVCVGALVTTTAAGPPDGRAALDWTQRPSSDHGAAGGVAAVVGCTYLVDDGTAETDVGVEGVGTIGMALPFVVEAQCPAPHAIGVTWGPHGAPQPAVFAIYDDPNDDGDPSDITPAHLIASATGVTTPASGVFIQYDLDPIPPESFFDVQLVFIVAMTEDLGDDYPLSADTSSASQGTSWAMLSIADTGDPFQSNGLMGVIDDLGLPGNWMMRTVSDPADLPPCPTDTDGNFTTDVDDLITVILQWDTAGPEGDVDGSGIVDVDDLLEVILGWGPCDFDGDDVADLTDNCPFHFNTDQANSDFDGLGNVCDNCWLAQNEDQADADFDTIGDACDNCPNTFNPEQIDDNQDATGDACAQFAADITPRILDQYPGRDLFTPRPFRVVSTNETVQAIVSIERVVETTATNVQASLIAPEIPGLTVLGNPAYYGDLAPGVSTPGLFTIQLAGAPVGLHLLQLDVSSDQGGQIINIWLPVWQIDMQVIGDPLLGELQGHIITPFTDDIVSLVAPEVLDPPGIPSFFDIQSEDVIRTLPEPFWGMHWGECYETNELEGGDGGIAGDGTVTVNGYVGDSCGNPVAGATVLMTKTSPPPPQAFTTTSGADGTFTFSDIPSGNYTRQMFTPHPYAMFHPTYNSSSTHDFDYGKWKATYKIPNVPPNAWPGAGNNTGATGPGGSATGGRGTQKSIIIGTGAKIGLTLLDAALALETAGATLLSAAAASTSGTVIGVMDDPLDMDIFWACEEHTVPPDPGEMTNGELLSMTYDMIQPPLGGLNLIASSTYEFTRMTDAGSSYVWSGGETLEVPVHLTLVAPTAIDDGGIVRVKTGVALPDGTPLSGGVPTVMAYQYQVGGFDVAGATILRDDGKEEDEAANDGLYTGVMPSPPPPALVFVWAQKTGFETDEIPPLIGYEEIPVVPGP